MSKFEIRNNIEFQKIIMTKTIQIFLVSNQFGILQCSFFQIVLFSFIDLNFCHLFFCFGFRASNFGFNTSIIQSFGLLDNGSLFWYKYYL